MGAWLPNELCLMRWASAVLEAPKAGAVLPRRSSSKTDRTSSESEYLALRKNLASGRSRKA